ncbi:MAG: glycosyltransferase [Paracoccaceae bacterium]
MPRRVDIGIFAHNEAQGIGAMLASLMAQDIHSRADLSVRVLVLANGCQDATVEVARGVPGVEVADLALGGKSRTWNRFVHELSRPDADILMFVDADIELPLTDALSRLVDGICARPSLRVLSSQPIKDIIARPEGLTFIERLIARATGGLDEWKSAICGQLYVMPAAIARRFHMPMGLPVEDGFLRAMVLTDALTGPEDLSRIDGQEGVHHLYASERRIGPLIRHQVRIVVGSAVNLACYQHIARLPGPARLAELAKATEEGWLDRVIKAELPRWPDGFVPLHFLVKRVARANWRSFRRWPVLILGFGFDLTVYVRAQIRMARGQGAGFW